MNINQLLELVVEKNASDLHLVVGYPPTLRISGDLQVVSGTVPLIPSDMESLLFPLLSSYQKEVLKRNWELDLGIDFQNKARFRINIYLQKGHLAASLRMIPNNIRSLEDTGLPPVVAKVTELKQGLVLVTGPTGHGKSTTLASFINLINRNRADHIITIEDPIEYVYPKGKSIISQRELNTDTQSWENALKYALREDPDVVLVGEMRDLETIAATMTIAETGHLVFATLHTNSASQSVDRIIDVFPENQQPQIRTQLAAVIESIISVRLIPTIAPGRTLASEVMFGTPAVRSVIRDGKSHLLDNLIQTSGELGMASLESSLATLIREGKITTEMGMDYAVRPQVLAKLLGGAVNRVQTKV